MRKQTIGLILVGVLITSFGIGYAFAYIYQNINITRSEQKPVIDMTDNRQQVAEDTIIIYEREYICGHVLISEFEHKKDLIGKTLEELKKTYTSENGYQMVLQDNSLIIHQLIDDWCPAAKEKCRLKIYQGLIAVYKGPDSENDNLARVTAISFNRLPQTIQEAIQAGEYEFKNEQELNDCLENLDEYL
jgi:hypothetical protein